MYYKGILKAGVELNITRVKTESLSNRVRESIYEYIKSMDVEKGTKLPREEILAKDLGVSRITVRKALNDLSKEGMIFSIHGKGTFINPIALQMQATLDPDLDFYQIILESGYKADVKLVDFRIEPAKCWEVDKLKATPNDLIINSEKAFYADGNLAIFCVDRFSRVIIDGDISRDDFEASPFNPFKFINIRSEKKLTWYKTELSTVISNQNSKLSSETDCGKPKAYLTCDSIYFDQFNEPMVYSTVYIDTDFIKVNVIRQKI